MRRDTTDGPPPLRFSVGAERVLRGAGWAPERRVDPTAWLAALTAEGWPTWLAAEAVLANLGGLVVRPEPRWGTRLSPRRFALDPMTLSGEADRLPIWEPKAGVALFPLGGAYGPNWLLMGEDGRVFVGISDGTLDLLGHDLREAMDILTLGVVGAGLPRPL